MARLWDGGFGRVDVRRVQPYQAAKTYVCPGCHRDIAPATGHYVAVPELAPELRRHWHYACWDRRVPVPAERARRSRTPPRSAPRRRR